MGPRKRSQIVARQRRQEARQTLARVPWPSEAERARDRGERVAALTSEERFRAQVDLLRLVQGNPKALAAAKRWHDLQNAAEQQCFRELFEQYEKKRRRAVAASRGASGHH